MEVRTMSEAMQLHAQLVKLGSPQNRNLSKVFTFAALAPGGDLKYAGVLLKSVPGLNSYYYNTLIRGYSQSSLHSEAFSLFLSMLEQPHRPPPDHFTFPVLLISAAVFNLRPLAEQLHAFLLKLGFSSHLYVQNALIHMYSLFRDSYAARHVFDQMPLRDIVSWTSLVHALVNDHRPVDAIRVFRRMLDAGVEVNEATVTLVLRACADSGALSMGRKVHDIAKERGFCSMSNVCTALVDMYAKSGCIQSARSVFDGVVDKDVFVWTSMISGLASHGFCMEAIELFGDMEKSLVKPDERTLTAVLSACRNAGLVRDAYAFFSSVPKRYGIEAKIQHFGCIVDLLARAGRLEEAEDFISTMPIEPDAVLWRTLIWACKVHGDTDRAQRLMNRLGLQEMNAGDSGSYILASNVYASVGKWSNKAEMRDLMNQKGLMKPPGSSRIEIDGVVHEFVMGDYNHPEAEKIFTQLDQMVDEVKKEGYAPKVAEVLLEMDDEEKAVQLLHHSEKLALSYGLIGTSEGSTIRIVKNLRSCEDCHQFMKLISKIYQREIIVRDRIRFHHFRNGHCSCKDYW